MMKPVEHVDGQGACAVSGKVRIDLKKSIWILIMIAGSLCAPAYVSWSAFGVFLISSYLTLLIGHSVGLHRMMIHRSFRAAKPLRRVLIFVGVLVGMGGPSNVIKIHDMRDWAQRLPDCHDYFSHKRSYAQDVFWQLFCRFDFKRPPRLLIEKDLSGDPFFIALDKGWWGLQILLALSLYSLGGVGWVLWGCCLRIFISIWGHWTVTYFCLNPGPGRWHVIGWGLIKFMEKRGWVFDVGQPRGADRRSDLRPG